MKVSLLRSWGGLQCRPRRWRRRLSHLGYRTRAPRCEICILRVELEAAPGKGGKRLSSPSLSRTNASAHRDGKLHVCGKQQPEGTGWMDGTSDQGNTSGRKRRGFQAAGHSVRAHAAAPGSLRVPFERNDMRIVREIGVAGGARARSWSSLLRYPEPQVPRSESQGCEGQEEHGVGERLDDWNQAQQDAWIRSSDIERAGCLEALLRQTWRCVYGRRQRPHHKLLHSRPSEYVSDRGTTEPDEMQFVETETRNHQWSQCIFETEDSEVHEGEEPKKESSAQLLRLYSALSFFLLPF